MCKVYGFAVVCLSFTVLLPACNNVSSSPVNTRSVATPLEVSRSPTPSPKQIDPRIISMSAEALCDQLKQIKVINDRRPEESDDIYKALVAKGWEALPCLVDKINDRTKTHDPRVAPVWQHYTVGDTAVFTILDIISKDDYEVWKELFLGPLPQNYKEEWKTNGVYAYFNYVSQPKNRKALQIWWRNWLQEKKDK